MVPDAGWSNHHDRHLIGERRTRVDFTSPSLNIAALGLAVSLVTVAVHFDLRYRRIPNLLIVSGLSAGLLLNVWQVGASGGGMALIGALAGFGMLLPFYMLRGVGAGDVKLLAALGAIVGPHALISIALYGAVVGGAMSLTALARQRQLSLAIGEILGQQRLPSSSGLKLPYGLAIASGVYLSLLVPAFVG